MKLEKYEINPKNHQWADPSYYKTQPVKFTRMQKAQMFGYELGLLMGSPVRYFKNKIEFHRKAALFTRERAAYLFRYHVYHGNLHEAKKQYNYLRHAPSRFGRVELRMAKLLSFKEAVLTERMMLHTEYMQMNQPFMDKLLDKIDKNLLKADVLEGQAKKLDAYKGYDVAHFEDLKKAADKAQAKKKNLKKELTRKREDYQKESVQVYGQPHQDRDAPLQQAYYERYQAFQEMELKKQAYNTAYACVNELPAEDPKHTELQGIYAEWYAASQKYAQKNVEYGQAHEKAYGLLPDDPKILALGVMRNELSQLQQEHYEAVQAAENAMEAYLCVEGGVEANSQASTRLELLAEAQKIRALVEHKKAELIGSEAANIQAIQAALAKQSLPALNKHIGRLLERERFVFLEDASRVEHLRKVYEYTYKKQKKAVFEKALGKVQNIHDNMLTKQFSKEEKLTLEDLGTIDSFGCFGEGSLKSLRLIGKEEAELKDKITLAMKLSRAIQNQVRKQTNLTTGDVNFHVHDKWYRYKRAPQNTVERLKRMFVTNLSHAGLFLVKREKDQPVLHTAEVWNNFEIKSTPLHDLAVANSYRLHFDKLIANKEWIAAKAKAKNQTPGEYVKERYQRVFQDFFKDPAKIGYLKNTEERRIKAGIGIHTRRHWWGGKRVRKKGFDEIKFGDKAKNGMICSEFAAKAILTCMARLNKQLALEYANELIAGGVPKKEAFEIARKSPGLNYPIPATEKLSRIHPGRLLNYLKPHMEKVDASPLLKNIVVFE